MPAKSAAQQMVAGAALSAKRGVTAKEDLKGTSKAMEQSMTANEFADLASITRKGLPEHKSED